MRISDIPVPEPYKQSADFRFFLRWIDKCFSQIKFDTENIVDLLDPERCPAHLLWLLGDTKGYKYDDRMSVAFNRLIIMYFMSLIRNRGSKTGITLAAELNLAQLNLNEYAKEDPAYEDRLADTSIPVNSAYVTSHTQEGYVDIVYFSEEVPTDVCLEYVRPIGMYCFTHSGVRVDSRTKISVDARLTDIADLASMIGPTRIGHYRRADYASMQKISVEDGEFVLERRKPVYYRNSDFEGRPTTMIDPGYRTLYSLQISNNEHIVKALIPSTQNIPEQIFSVGYGPQNVGVVYPDNYLKHDDYPEFNLRYDLGYDLSRGEDIFVNDLDRTFDIVHPRPAVNPVMGQMGDSMSMSANNHLYTRWNSERQRYEIYEEHKVEPEPFEPDDGENNED